MKEWKRKWKLLSLQGGICAFAPGHYEDWLGVHEHIRLEAPKLNSAILRSQPDTLPSPAFLSGTGRVY